MGMYFQSEMLLTSLPDDSPKSVIRNDKLAALLSFLVLNSGTLHRIRRLIVPAAMKGGFRAKWGSVWILALNVTVNKTQLSRGLEAW